jgi:hypothetical protein
MGFSVMQGSYGSIWYPVDDNAASYETLYLGQIVKGASDGVMNLGVAAAGNATASSLSIMGVVVGTNNATPLFNSTYKAEYITSVAPHDNTTDYRLSGGSGKMITGDKTAAVKVDVIGPGTILKGPIFNAAVGTAITVGTVTTGSSAGTGFTCSAGLMDFAGTVTADRSTVYCRTGANRGIYRVCTDASTTVKTVDHDFPYDIAVGDTFVGVHLRPVGLCVTQLDSEAMYINAYGTTDSVYYTIDVLALDLSVAGQEHAIFRFVY